MQIPTMNELQRLSRQELSDLHAALLRWLDGPLSAGERTLALEALEHIRGLLARPRPFRKPLGSPSP